MRVFTRNTGDTPINVVCVRSLSKGECGLLPRAESAMLLPTFEPGEQHLRFP